MPKLEFRAVSKAYPDGTTAVQDLDLAVPDGEFLCVLGPSGCGKSSTLRMLAGLEAVTSGDIIVEGMRINDVPPHKRDMAMVFENYALYPHLDVFHNIAMPLVARRTNNEEVRRRVTKICETLRISEHMHKRPKTLSGGQRQRVALGRAMVRNPRVFLMDEPLGHLEAYLRVELRTEIRRLHEELRTTSIYITHDQQEAGALADRIAVLNAGRLQQVGSLIDLLEGPANRFVAQFVGEWPINLLPATITMGGEGAKLQVGDFRLPLASRQAAMLPSNVAGAPIELGLRPEDARLVAIESGKSLNGRVLVVEPQGDMSLVVTETSAGQINAVVASNESPNVGDTVGLAFDPSSVHLFSPDGKSLFHGAGGSGRH
jgi:multiple sugar transport system ATP-binding protein